MTIDEAVRKAGADYDRIRADIRRRFLTAMLTDVARSIGGGKNP